MSGLICSPCTQTGCGSQISGCQTDFKRVFEISPATYIFPFGDQDVFCFNGSSVAGDDQRSSVEATDGLQTAGCGRQRHICQLDGQRRQLFLILP